jgi:hypothetical protein
MSRRRRPGLCVSLKRMSQDLWRGCTGSGDGDGDGTANASVHVLETR